MRNALLLSFVLAASPAVFAQTPPAQTPPKTGAPTPTPPRTGAPTPAQPRPRTTTPAPATGRSGMAITASSGSGGTLEGVHVEVTGPMERTGDTNAAGQVNFPGLPPGTYRVRFSGESVVTFEREAVLQAGKITAVQVTLSAAEVKKEAPRPPVAPVAPPPPSIGPIGMPQWGSLTDLAKRAQQSKPPRREILLACSGNSRSELIVLTEDQAQRVYADAESTYYVLDGQGVITIGKQPGDVSTGSFVAVPRGQAFTITRRANKPLVMLWVLSGAKCEEAR